MREIVFDTETTGRASEEGDRIVEIGCVELFNLTPTGRTFQRYVNPERDVPDEVVRVHGITAQFLSDKPVFAHPSIVDELLDFFGEDAIIAHNAAFDRAFLNAELARINRPVLPAERFIDTLDLARARFRGAANSLDALSRRYMLDRDGFDLAARRGPGGHGALVDAKILARVYLELKGGREQSLAFEEKAAGDASAQVGVLRTPRAQRPVPLLRRITAEEADAHAAFVAALGAGALWVKLGLIKPQAG